MSDHDRIPNGVKWIDTANIERPRRTTASFAPCRATDREADTALVSGASRPKELNSQSYLNAMRSRGRSPGQPALTASFASCRATDPEAGTALVSGASRPKGSNKQSYPNAMESRRRSPGRPVPTAVRTRGTPWDRERPGAEPETGALQAVVRDGTKSRTAAPTRVPSQSARGASPKTIRTHASGKSPSPQNHQVGLNHVLTLASQLPKVIATVRTSSVPHPPPRTGGSLGNQHADFVE
ncbi:hypothetical protein GP486_005544 [Trichoglossum hirsutum]|uniref:Uncharacterized protein n=1 Tax=Trichoglossum hirsutum TaxID=265104 RepID=A0A9P8L8Y4_9PEZI|nr:hypothetical protein GP486_005544 [Trichoglossum hirsutum]